MLMFCWDSEDEIWSRFMSEPFNLRVRCAFGNVFFVPVFPLQQGKGKTLLAFQPNMVSTIQIQPSPFDTFCQKKRKQQKELILS